MVAVQSKILDSVNVCMIDLCLWLWRRLPIVSWLSLNAIHRSYTCVLTEYCPWTVVLVFAEYQSVLHILSPKIPHYIPSLSFYWFIHTASSSRTKCMCQVQFIYGGEACEFTVHQWLWSVTLLNEKEWKFWVSFEPPTHSTMEESLHVERMSCGTEACASSNDLTTLMMLGESVSEILAPTRQTPLPPLVW